MRLLLLIMLIMLIIWPLPNMAATPNLTELTADALEERAQQSLLALQAIQTRLQTLTQQDAEIVTQLNANATERQASGASKLPNTATAPRTTDAATALIKAWETYTQALTQRKTALEKRSILAKQRRDLALQLADETQLFVAARDAATPLWNEVARRMAQDANAIKIEAATLKKIQGDLKKERNTEIERWRGEAARAAVTLAESDAVLTGITTEMNIAKTGQQQAMVWLQEATLRDQQRQALTERDVNDRFGLLNAQIAEWRTSDSLLQTRLNELDTKLAAIDAKEQEIQALNPAETVLDNSDTALESLSNAQRTLQQSQSNTEFRQARLAALQGLQTDLTTLLTTLSESQTAVNAGFETTLALDVLIEVIREGAGRRRLRLPADAEQVPLRLSHLRERRQQLAATLVVRQAQDATLTKRIAEAKTGVTEAQTAVTSAQQNLEREERWASFIEQVENLEGSALIAAFQKALSDFANANTERERALGQANLTATALKAAQDAQDGHNDPVVIAMTQQGQLFDKWLESKGLRRIAILGVEKTIADTTAATTPAVTTAATAPAPAPTTTITATTPAPTLTEATPVASASAAPAQSSVTHNWLETTRTQRDQLVTRRLTSFQESQQLRKQLKDAVTAHIDSLEAQKKATETAAEFARQAWGAATTLYLRQTQEQIAETDLPQDIKDWQSRERALTLQTEVDQITKLLAALATEQAVLEEDDLNQLFIPPLSDWQTSLDSQLQSLGDYLSLETQFSIPNDLTKLGDLELRMLEREVNNRIARDLGAYNAIGNFFSTQQTKTIDELLRRYYQRLILLEKQIKNVGDRQNELKRLTEQVEGSREILTALLKTVDTEVQQATVTMAVELTKVQAALTPSQMTQLLEALEKETRIKLDPKKIPNLIAPASNSAEATTPDTKATTASMVPDVKAGVITPTSPDVQSVDAEVTQRNAHNDLIATLLPFWARQAGYQQWQTQLKNQIAKLGGLDSYVGAIKDLVASLEAQHADLDRQRGRLAGFSGAELGKLLAEKDVDLNQAQLGEIGLLQSERQKVINWHMVKSVVSLILIPVLALFAIFFARRAGRHLVNRAIVKDDQDGAHAAERKVRADTLFGIFQTTWTLLIVALAIIYMLQVVSIDVTPLIASLGIFGLAIAFGARPVMSDLFAGFFLLLENQLNRGDEVTINGCSGVVDGVGLRLTKLRDFYTGQLHFIPNGQIKMVSNSSKEYSRIFLRILVDLDQDAEEVRALLQTEGELPALLRSFRRTSQPRPSG